MKTLKELKDYTRKEIQEIGLANEEKYDFVVSFGVKKVEITVKINGDNKDKRFFLKNYKVETKLVDSRGDQAFVIVKDTYMNSCLGYVENGPEDKLIKELITILLNYWIQYKNLKKLKALYVDYKKYAVNEKAKLYKDILTATGFSRIEGYGNVLIKPDDFKLHSAIMDEDWRNRVETVLGLSREVDALLKIHQTFNLEGEDSPGKEIFLLELQEFYFENEKFQMIPLNGHVKVVGETIEETSFPCESGVAEKSILYVQEQKRLYNLMNTPIKYIKELFNDVLQSWHSEKALEETVEKLESEIGFGETEKECSKMIEVVKKYMGMNEYTRRGHSEAKENFNKLVTEFFQYYMVKTDKYYWHILIEDGRHFWMTPSLTKDYPDRIHDAMKSVMVRAIEQRN